MHYLGRYSCGDVRVTLFWEPRGSVIASVVSHGASCVVQAFAKLVLREGPLKKGVDLAHLHGILESHSASIEFLTTKATPELAARVAPPDAKKSRWFEHALRCVERDLEREKNAYSEWRGVRDLDEAEENLRARKEQIFDLNQKLIANEREPQFVYGDRKWRVSEFQTIDRVRFRELKEQTKERASAVRQRIDFTRRQCIKDLEAKVRELNEELEGERKMEADQEKHTASVIDEGLAATLLVTVRSTPVFVRGRKGEAVAHVFEEIMKEATTLRKKLHERLGLRFEAVDETLALSPLFIMNPAALKAARDAGAVDLASAIERSFALAPRDATEKALAKTLVAMLGNVPPKTVLPDLSRFPPLADTKTKRLVYLGHALDSTLRPTALPVFFDLDAQGPRHASVTGGSGSGKSVAAHLLVEGAALHGVPALVFDPTRSWTGFAVPCTSGPLKRYDAFQMKPEWARSFEVRIADVTQGLDVHDLLTSMTVSIVPAWALKPEQEKAVVADLLRRIQKEVFGWPEANRLVAWLVFEEAHRYLQDPSLESLLELLARTARAKGLGMLFVSQNNVDLPPGVRNNCATKIQMQTSYAPDLTRAAQTFGSDLAKKIPAFQQGNGAVNYPEFGTALVAFRPPLHSPYAISEEVAQFYQVTRDLGRVMKGLLTMDGIPDGMPERPDKLLTTDTTNVSVNESLVNEGSEPHNDDAPLTWRDVGTAFVSTCRSKPTAPELAEAIRVAGFKPPTERTLYRFLEFKTRSAGDS